MEKVLDSRCRSRHLVGQVIQTFACFLVIETENFSFIERAINF